MQLDLTPEEIRWINEKVESGEYESPDALISEALQLWQESEEEKELVSKGLMRLPKEEKNDAFLDIPAPHVEINTIRRIIREERDAD